MDKSSRSLAISFWARFYDQITSFIGFGDKFRSETVQFGGVSDLKGPARILDVGCGTGKLTLAAATNLPPGSRVYGIDPVSNMLLVACLNRFKTPLPQDGRIQVTFKVGRIEAIPFKDNSFDLVFTSMMTHHLDRGLKYRGFREIARVLKPGGSLLNVDFGIIPSHQGGRFKSVVKLGAFLYFNLIETLRSNFMLLVKDHFTGVIPSMLLRAGFVRVKYLPSHHNWVVFLRAQKPVS